MRGGDNMTVSRLLENPCHLQTFLQGLGPVVDPVQYVTVQINHFIGSRLKGWYLVPKAESSQLKVKDQL
jgi:hypothetical protein